MSTREIYPDCGGGIGQPHLNKCDIMLNTKKAARQAGYRGEGELLRSSCRMTPKRGVKPLVIKGEPFFRLADCERLLNKTGARRSGLRVPVALEPVVWQSWRYGIFGLWRESDLVPLAGRTGKPAVAIALLAAIFAVNRSAKRYRDSAASCYSSGSHGLAKAAKERKHRLYDLKDRGIAKAHRLKGIQFVGRNGALALYRGEGYCFHSRLVPPDAACEPDQGQEAVFVEARPKTAG